MNLKLPQLVAVTGAIILLYCAIKDVSPAELIKAVLTGSALPKAGSGNPDAPLPARTDVVDANGNKTGGYINGKGQYIPPTDATTKQPNPPQARNDAYTSPYTTPYQVVSV